MLSARGQAMERPDEEEVAETMKETQAALDRLVNGKIVAAQPKTLPAAPGAPTYIKYTPSQQGPQYNSGASQRIIKMQDMPVDPMEPPKFRHKKARAHAPRAPFPCSRSFLGHCCLTLCTACPGLQCDGPTGCCSMGCLSGGSICQSLWAVFSQHMLADQPLFLLGEKPEVTYGNAWPAEDAFKFTSNKLLSSARAA